MRCYMIEAVSGAILALLGCYIFFHEEPKSRYILLIMIFVWFSLILALYFGKLSTLPFLYFENL